MPNLHIPLKNTPAHPGNYGGKLDKVEWIVVHYTANDGDTDENNGKYFGKELERKASAHLFVDDDSATISVPLTSVAFHCGTTGKYKHPTCRNSNSIGVEICDDVRNGKIYPSTKTIENVLAVVRWLMEKYNLPKERVIRHADVTGKACPAYWVDDAKWKSEFWDRLEDEMTQEQFDKMMDAWLAKREKMATSAWAVKELGEAKAKGITDGTKPRAFATREEVAAMVLRATK